MRRTIQQREEVRHHVRRKNEERDPVKKCHEACAVVRRLRGGVGTWRYGASNMAVTLTCILRTLSRTRALGLDKLAQVCVCEVL